MIRFEHVTKSYPDGTTAVDDLTFEVNEGELVTLVGPSGCGKTTTMKMVNRLIEPTGGRILLDGEDISTLDPVQLRRRIGYVIQQVGLFPHKTVLDNTATVPHLLGRPRREARARAAELLDLVGLDPSTYGDRYPEQLSGGQRQRVGVARALAADPPVLLMDEPFGAVDPVVRTQLQNELLRLQEELRKTVVFVTHDIDEAVRLGDRIAVFRTGGRLVQCAPPAELLARPADDFVADFLGAERGLKLLSLTTLADVPYAPGREIRADEPVGAISRDGDRWRLVTSPRGEPLGWLDTDALPAGGTAGEAPLEAVRPLRDSDSLLSALNEAVSSPAAAVARVTADGVLTGLTSRDAIHERAGRSHAEAGRAAAATEPAPEPPVAKDAEDGKDAKDTDDAASLKTASAPEPSA